MILSPIFVLKIKGELSVKTLPTANDPSAWRLPIFSRKCVSRFPHWNQSAHLCWSNRETYHLSFLLKKLRTDGWGTISIPKCTLASRPDSLGPYCSSLLCSPQSPLLNLSSPAASLNFPSPSSIHNRQYVVFSFYFHLSINPILFIFWSI